MTAADLPGGQSTTGQPGTSWWRRFGRACWSAWGGHVDAMLRGCAYAYPAYLPVEPVASGCVPDDEWLCRRWRESGARLAGSSEALEVLSIVAERQRCLDELEQRHPERFAAWLAAWPRSAHDPLPYLSTECVEGPSIEWHQLLGGDEGPTLRDPA